MHVIRTYVTFTFDETKVTADVIRDRLYAPLLDAFTDVDDLHVRWVIERVPPRDRRGTQTIRAHVTFEFDEAAVPPQTIRARFEPWLRAHCPDVEDMTARWVSDMAESPLFAAALRDERGPSIRRTQ